MIYYTFINHNNTIFSDLAVSFKKTEQNRCDLSDVFYVHVAFG